MMSRLSGLLGGVLAFAGLATANAGMIIESETGGTATNNSVATAQAISNADFTIDPSADVFTAADAGLGGTAITATAVGELGIGTFDVDFWSFTMLADGYAWFDVDSPGTQSTVLHLFNSAGTLIALDRFSFFDLDGMGPGGLGPDSGSGSTLDPFIGETLLTAGMYYVAISEDPNQATGGGTGTFSMQTPSFFPPSSSWTTVSGAAVGNDSFLSPGSEGLTGGNYRLHISQIQADPGDVTQTPEPAAAAMFGIGGLLLLGYGWRSRNKRKGKDWAKTRTA